MITKSFHCTNRPEFFHVPSGVYSLNLALFGANGGQLEDDFTTTKGGQTTAVLAVSPGDILEIRTGCKGGDVLDSNMEKGGQGGYGIGHGGNGSDGYNGYAGGTGGGGATGIIYKSQIIVAGAAGGISGQGNRGGYGGGFIGGTGNYGKAGGKGGTWKSAGKGGQGLINGEDGHGMDGGNGAAVGLNPLDGNGGGGGGKNSGGGGAVDENLESSGGGGGSGHADPIFRNAVLIPDVNDQGDGLVLISYTPISVSLSANISCSLVFIHQPISCSVEITGIDHFSGASVTFSVHGPFLAKKSFANCFSQNFLLNDGGNHKEPVTSFVVPVNGPITKSPDFVPILAGMYSWSVTFNRDTLSVSTHRDDNSLDFVVKKAVPCLH